MGFLKDRFLTLTLALGLLIRLALSILPGFKFDIDTWFAWAQRLNEVGFPNFYSDKIWTTYTPGFLYILAFLGYLKNLLQIPDGYFFIVLKLPSIIAEVMTGYISYLIIPNKHWKKIALIFVIFNPAFIFNSAVFGQFDGLFSLVLLLSVYFLIQKRLVLSSIFYALAFSLKPQAIIVIPVFLFFMLKNLSIKNIIKLTLPAILTTELSFLPFFSTNLINGPVNLILNILNTYPYASIFAYNLWGIFGFWVPDNKAFLNTSYQNWGYILLIFFWVVVIYVYIKIKKLSFFALAVLSSLSFFFLVTRMHERYLYPSLIFLILFATLKKSKLLLYFVLILTIIHFLDLYYVYIYYTQFFLKENSVLYNPDLYNLLENNITIISFFSTIVFFVICKGILKLDHED